MRYPRFILALAFALVAVVSFPAEQAKAEESGIPMLSGGVGEDEFDHLQGTRARYNMRLLFAQTDGAYVSDVEVSLLSAKGHEIAHTVAHGPLLFLKLKPGNYSVKATLGGISRTVKFTVPASGMGHASVRFPVPDNAD